MIVGVVVIVVVIVGVVDSAAFGDRRPQTRPSAVSSSIDRRSLVHPA